MTTLLRSILAVLVVLTMSAPSTGIGGGGGGGTGVWILPGCAMLSSSTYDPNAPVRETFFAGDTSEDLVLRVSPGMGAATACFIEDVSGTVYPLQVHSREVTIPKTLLQSLETAGSGAGTILIVDSQQRGYLLRLKVAADGEVVLDVL